MLAAFHLAASVSGTVIAFLGTMILVTPEPFPLCRACCEKGLLWFNTNL